MNLVLATDIFGVTPWIEVLTARWQSAGHKVLLCSPYQANHKFSN